MARGDETTPEHMNSLPTKKKTRSESSLFIVTSPGCLAVPNP